jgi:hypothetical protein
MLFFGGLARWMLSYGLKWGRTGSALSQTTKVSKTFVVLKQNALTVILYDLCDLNDLNGKSQ